LEAEKARENADKGMTDNTDKMRKVRAWGKTQISSKHKKREQVTSFATGKLQKYLQ
jgi:TnpA family transposase